MALAGARAKNALHVLLYAKALRLPVSSSSSSSSAAAAASSTSTTSRFCPGPIRSCAPSPGDDDDDDDEEEEEEEEEDAEEEANEGNLDMGLIMNLASEDILNIGELVGGGGGTTFSLPKLFCFSSLFFFFNV